MQHICKRHLIIVSYSLGVSCIVQLLSHGTIRLGIVDIHDGYYVHLNSKIEIMACPTPFFPRKNKAYVYELHVDICIC